MDRVESDVDHSGRAISRIEGIVGVAALLELRIALWVFRRMMHCGVESPANGDSGLAPFDLDQIQNGRIRILMRRVGVGWFLIKLSLTGL